MNNLLKSVLGLCMVTMLVLAGNAGPRDDETIGTLPRRMPAAETAAQGTMMVGNGSTSQAQASQQTMTTSWQSGTLTHTVKTDRKPNENAESQASRHKQGVDALAGVFPPTGPPPPPPGSLSSYFESAWYSTPFGQAYGYIVVVRTNHEPAMTLVGADSNQTMAEQAQMHFEGVQELELHFPANVF